MKPVTLFTIGFTLKSAETFFTLLENAGVRRMIDIRLRPSSQLAGFAKGEDLRFFLKKIGRMEYLTVPELAPAKELLADFREGGCGWSEYERRYLALLAERGAEHSMKRNMLDRGCLLCSEHDPGECHRRLAAEYLAEKLREIEIVHLV